MHSSTAVDLKFGPIHTDASIKSKIFPMRPKLQKALQPQRQNKFFLSKAENHLRNQKIQKKLCLRRNRKPFLQTEPLKQRDEMKINYTILYRAFIKQQSFIITQAFIK